VTTPLYLSNFLHNMARADHSNKVYCPDCDCYVYINGLQTSCGH
jgi:hypothetical protein